MYERVFEVLFRFVEQRRDSIDDVGEEPRIVPGLSPGLEQALCIVTRGPSVLGQDFIGGTNSFPETSDGVLGGGPEDIWSGTSLYQYF